ncbi:MAG: AAA family ATPase, partial [Clostridiales bacterium]|nr:AAA family ATPase [Clostridiales bacterium]
MKIRRLYIGDFGILRNQVLENVNPGIVVIGGLNRAGKSTFMQVLKYLGFGFPTGKGLPPASGKYEVEADIGLNVGDTYNLRLSGYAQPSIRRTFGSDTEFASARDIFELDDFTYQRLFIITLDELNRSMAVPSQEKRKLQSILLGAGFSDMLFIPRLEKDFTNE